MRRSVTALLCLGALAVGSVSAAPPDQVSASHAWIRVLPGTLPAAAYVTLRNTGDHTVELVGASSPTYAQIMLHRSTTEGGTSRMSAVPALAIPAHGSVQLAPAGYHLMLMQAGQQVIPGRHVTLTLQFKDGSSLPTDFLARPANALDDGSIGAKRGH